MTDHFDDENNEENEKSFADKMVNQIYGKEFHSYSKEEKIEAKDNIRFYLSDIYGQAQYAFYNLSLQKITLEGNQEII